jgi:hypothetical protein
VTGRFNLYDFLGYLTPGFVTILLVALFLGSHVPWKEIYFFKDFEFLAFVVLFVVSYLTGHLIQVFRNRLRGLNNWHSVWHELWPHPVSTIVGVMLSFFKPSSIADLARTHMFSAALLSDNGRAGDVEVRAHHRIPQPQLRKLRKQLGVTFGLPMTSEDHYQSAWSGARAWLASRQGSGNAELYNALAAMFRNLGIVFRTAPWLAFATLVVELSRAWPFTFDLEGMEWVWTEAWQEVLLLAIAAVVARLSTWLKLQYTNLELLFAREILLAFQGCVSLDFPTTGPGSPDGR